MRWSVQYRERSDWMLHSTSLYDSHNCQPSFSSLKLRIRSLRSRYCIDRAPRDGSYDVLCKAPAHRKAFSYPTQNELTSKAASIKHAQARPCGLLQTVCSHHVLITEPFYRR